MKEVLHATCVAIHGRGVLLTGRSGSGKSDLALRLLDRGAVLVSDDGTVVEAHGTMLVARAGPHIAGLIEVRGIGIMPWTTVPEAPVALVVALDQAVPRMMEESPPIRTLAGINVPMVALAGLESSAPVKVEQALLLYGIAP